MGWGDEIVAAGQAQRIWDADPSMRIAIVGRDNEPRWHPIWHGNPILARPEEVAAGAPVRRVMSGPGCRPYIVYPFTTDSGWTFSPTFRCRDHVARLYLTEKELKHAQALRKRLGAFVLIEPYTKHQNFRWPFTKWAELVEACPDVTFVQHVHSDSRRIPGVQYESATFREVCALLTEADCYVRSESGLCHAAAAVECPTVTIFGGCMDADVMGGYPLQTCLVDASPETPCGQWNPCSHCANAMDRLSVESVVDAMRLRMNAEVSCAAH